MSSSKQGEGVSPGRDSTGGDSTNGDSTGGDSTSRGQPVIILAAGKGVRFGKPKIFAEHGGHTFLERILTRCRATGARVTLVSDPRHRSELDALLARLPPSLLAPFPRMVAGDAGDSMFASVQSALRHGPYVPGFWLWPVDAPFISAGGWRTAVEAVAGAPDRIWKLRVGGRTGHPIWFPEASVAGILAGDWKDGLRGYLAGAEAVRILVLEGEILHDIDRVGQLEDLVLPDDPS